MAGQIRIIMKAQILKLAKVKDEKAFYKKYPTEESFMAVHGAKLKKMMLSDTLQKANVGITVPFKNVPAQQPFQFQAQGIGDIVPQAYQPQYTSEFNPMKPMQSKPMFDSNWGLQGVDTKTLSQPKEEKKGILSGLTAPADNLLKGIDTLIQEGKQAKTADQWNRVSKLQLEAARTSPEEIERQYVRPEDSVISPGQLSPQYFTKNGGKIKKANWGTALGKLSEQGMAQGSNSISSYAGKAWDFNAGSQIGGAVGEGLGMINPVLGAIAKPILTYIGGAVDPYAKKIKKYTNQMNANINNMALMNGVGGVQQQYSGFMEDGGKLTPLRTGGNIRRNQFFETDKYAMGGDLQLYDGNAEVISNNPYSPEEGDTMMLKGPSHAEGGMDIAYGGNPVEAEGGEPVMKGQDGDLTIFGNMKIGKELVPLLGDENAKGKKFKNYIADLSKEEAKHNRLKDKSLMSMSDLKIEIPLDKLKANSFKYNAAGADSKLADIAEKKQKASNLQTAMLDTANEIGVDPDALSRGQIKKAKMGANIPMAGNGDNLEKLSKADYDYLSSLYRMAVYGNPKVVENFQKEFHRLAPNRAKKVLSNYDVTNYGKAKGYTKEQLQSNEDGLFGKRTEDYIAALSEYDNFDGDISLDRLKATTYNKPVEATKPKSSIQAQENDTNNLSRIDMLASALPYFRPTDAEALDPRQLAGEMYALSTNQLEPVQAQQYHPDLSSPYEISLQDQLNEIIADKRAAERMSGYNPAAQSYIASQAYGAKSKVLGEQTRINQAMKDKTFGENRNLLNQAKLQNLQILDNQYTRQAQAKSNTKDITQNALSSIAAKYQQNELERKTLQTYENMYNYRFGDNMRAQNWNGPALFNEPTVGSIRSSRGEDIPPEGYEYVQTLKKIAESKKSNGGIVSAYRKL